MSLMQKIGGIFAKPAPVVAPAALVTPPPAPYVAPADPASPSLRSRNKVVDYVEATPELQAKMDKLLEPIERVPSSYEAVMSFGASPLQQFESWARRVEGLCASMPKAGAVPPTMLREIEMLGLARLEITREMNVCLGAVKEALRRYNEEYIPEAAAQEAASHDPEDELDLKDTMRRKDDFIDRALLLEKTRTISVMAAQQLRMLLEHAEAGSLPQASAKALSGTLESWRQTAAGGTIYTAPPSLDIRALDSRVNVFKKPLSFKKPAPAA